MLDHYSARMVLVLLLALGLTAAAAPAQAQVPEAAPPLTLAQAVARARADSPLRRAPQGLVDGTNAAAQLAGRLLNPVVEVRGENWKTSDRELPLDVFATVSQPFELGGKRSTRQGLAAAERDIAHSNLAAVERQVAIRTVELYVQALKARGLFDTLTANREGLTTLTETMRRRVAEGLSAEADLLKFATEGARVDIEVARARLDLARSLNTLTFVIGAPAPVTAAQLIEPQAAAPPRVDRAALAAAAERHPEVRTASARVARARQLAALEHARRLPDPIITAGLKRTAGLNTALAGVMFTMPLFDRNGSAAARAAGEERAAAADRDALTLRLTSEAESLSETAQTLAARSTSAVLELLEPAEAVRNSARAAFREGAVDVLKLIDAERVYADVRRTALELRLEALLATIEARFALGEETLP